MVVMIGGRDTIWLIDKCVGTERININDDDRN